MDVLLCMVMCSFLSYVQGIVIGVYHKTGTVCAPSSHVNHKVHVVNVTSKTDCAVRCSSRTGCSIFGHSKVTSRCSIQEHKGGDVETSFCSLSLEVYGKHKPTGLTTPSHKLSTNVTKLQKEQQKFKKYCRKGDLVGTHCFFIVYNHKMNWFRAKLQCRKESGYLAEIHSEEEQKLLTEYLHGRTASVCLWSGGKRENSRWKWMGTNKPISFWNWADGEPNGQKGFIQETCIDMDYFSRWRDQKCYLFCQFMCQFRYEGSVNEEYLIGDCEGEDGSFRGSCYRLVKEVRSWASAVKGCQKLNMTLVEIFSAEEQMFIQHYLRYIRVTPDAHIWIGLSDHVTERSWTWSGSGRLMAYSNWASKQPDGKHRSFDIFGHVEEDCVEIQLWDNFLWNDCTCSRKNWFLCESN